MTNTYIYYIYFHFIIYRAIMRCTYSGDFNVMHTKKRRLVGLEKKRALEHMIDRKEAPSVYTTNEARRMMKSGN